MQRVLVLHGVSCLTLHCVWGSMWMLVDALCIDTDTGHRHMTPAITRAAADAALAISAGITIAVIACLIIDRFYRFYA